MKLIFRDNGVLWIINKDESHKDVDCCTTMIVPNSFDPVKREHEGVLTYKTLDEVRAEIVRQDSHARVAADRDMEEAP